MKLRRMLFECPKCPGSRVLQEHDMDVTARWQAYCYACEGELTLLSDDASPALPLGPSHPRVMVGVVTRGTDSKLPFVLSMLRVPSVLRAADIGVRVVLQSGGSIQIGRNRLVTTFLESDATHLHMIDDDLEFLAEDIVRFVRHDRDIVAGAYATRDINWPEVAKAIHGKRDPRLYTSAIAVHLRQPLVREGDLVEADGVAGGFTMIKREVLERMIAEYPTLRFWNHSDQCHHSMLFDTSIDPERGHCSEDYTFSKRWRALGGRIWVDAHARFSHIGSHAFIAATLGEHLDQLVKNGARDASPILLALDRGVLDDAGKLEMGM